MDEENNLMEESSEEESDCEDQIVQIRVGDKYQAEIPPMLSESGRAMLLSNPLALDLNSDPLCSHVVGQPVEVMWIDTKSRGGDDNVDMNESLKSLKTRRSRRGESDANAQGSKKQRMNLLEAVPEKTFSSWEDVEVGGFVLGLYTFGKKFLQVKEFLKSRGTGEILSFYYGKFYKSVRYKIWYNSLKKQSRKCKLGKKLYSKWRLHLLLSRLIPKITDEAKKQELVNVSKSFAEEKTSLEKFISEVKELVGLQALVEAVAIGKDKEDLSVLTTEPVNSKRWFTVSSPAAPAAGLGPYSSLTADDIIKILTGGSRLSKARSNEIFWEAVWPRLLGRGWHSEEPKDRGYIKSKDNLVFLVPGVKKFSRRKLVKWNHYFDSISDILNKVVSDPELLELDTAKIKAPNGSIEEKHRYLKSPGSSSSTRMKFTVVDTSSLATGGKLCELRELKNPNPESVLSQSKEDSSVGNFQTKPLDLQKRGRFNDEGASSSKTRQMKKVVDEPKRFMIVDTSMGNGGVRRRRHLPGDDKIRKSAGDSTQNQSGTKGTESGVKEETLENAQQGYRSKKRYARKSGSVNNYSVSSIHLPKRRRLSACVRKDIRRSGESSVFKPPKSSVDSVNLKTDQSEETGHGLSLHLEIQERKETEPNGLCPISGSVYEVRSSEQDQQKEDKSNRFGSMSVLDKKCSSKDLETVQQQEKPIKLPSVSSSDKNSPSADHGTAAQELASGKQQQEEEQNQETNIAAPRRQSTRKRPLTTRALEAMESGFFIAKSMKTTSKPRKRERSTRIKHSANAINRTQGKSDNGFLVDEATTGKPLDKLENSEPSFLVNEATTASKPADQKEDLKKVTTEFPKLPSIVLKFPSKRG